MRAWRRTERAAQADGEQVRLASRSLSTRVDEEGMVVIRGRLTPEEGAVVLRALEAALEQVPGVGPEGAEPTFAQRRADALGLVAESALAGALDPGPAGDRFQVTVHVAAETLAGAPDVSAATCRTGEAAAAVASETGPTAMQTLATGMPGPAAGARESGAVGPEAVAGEPSAVPGGAGVEAGIGVIEQGGGLDVSAATSRRIACDAGLVVAYHAAGGEVLDVGRRTRTIPTPLRRALEVRDQH